MWNWSISGSYKPWIYKTKKCYPLQRLSDHNKKRKNVDSGKLESTQKAGCESKTSYKGRIPEMLVLLVCLFVCLFVCLLFRGRGYSTPRYFGSTLLFYFWSSYIKSKLLMNNGTSFTNKPHSNKSSPSQKIDILKTKVPWPGAEIELNKLLAVHKWLNTLRHTLISEYILGTWYQSQAFEL